MKTKWSENYSPKWVRRACPGRPWGIPHPMCRCRRFASLYSRRPLPLADRPCGMCTTGSLSWGWLHWRWAVARARLHPRPFRDLHRITAAIINVFSSNETLRINHTPKYPSKFLFHPVQKLNFAQNVKHCPCWQQNISQIHLWWVYQSEMRKVPLQHIHNVWHHFNWHFMIFNFNNNNNNNSNNVNVS